LIGIFQTNAQFSKTQKKSAMKNLFNSGLIIFTVILFGSCQTSTIKKDMADFDKAFIPAWYFAYTGDLQGTQKAMIPLLRQRQIFEKNTPVNFTNQTIGMNLSD
jgi:hypothetical protein